MKDILSEQIVQISFLGQMIASKRKSMRKENILSLVLGNEWTVKKYVYGFHACKTTQFKLLAEDRVKTSDCVFHRHQASFVWERERRDKTSLEVGPVAVVSVEENLRWLF